MYFYLLAILTVIMHQFNSMIHLNKFIYLLLWNEIPTKLRALPKASFKKKIQMILLKILENEVSYKDLEFIISKVNFYFP